MVNEQWWSKNMSKGDDIEERLIGFGVRVIRLCSRLPDTFVAQHIGKQLVRSGTAPAAHYAEARGAEVRRSRSDVPMTRRVPPPEQPWQHRTATG